jgi:phage-related protein
VPRKQVDAPDRVCHYWHSDVKTLVAQAGETHHNAKPLHGLGSGVMEITANDRSGAYRAVYAVSFKNTIYVLHAFLKKSKSGTATPLTEIELVRQRLKQLRSEVKE